MIDNICCKSANFQNLLKNSLTTTIKIKIYFTCVGPTAMRKFRCHALKLVPEEIASNLPESEFTVIPDPDSHDYIISVQYLNSFDNLPCSDLASRLYKKSIRLYPHHTIQCNPMNQIVPGQFINLYKRWAKGKELDHLELNEYNAFERYIHQMDTGNYLVSLHDGNRMIGFASFEILNEKYAICHFAKAEKVYKGV